MSDEYLWDRTGPPDPEVQRLEELLLPLGRQKHAAPTTGDPALRPPATQADARAAWTKDARRWRLALAAAAILTIVAGGWWVTGRVRPHASPWTVTTIDGAPTIASRRIGAQGELAVGGWLETKEHDKARITVANIGRVDVDPRTRLRLVSSSTDNYRLQLLRGTLHATITAPAGQFFVDTPSSTAIDLGCAYSLTIDEQGAGAVAVSLGWVGFEWKGRESFIPAGSICLTRPGIGPGTPYHERSSAAYRAALETLDFRGGTPETTAAVTRVLDESGERDEVTLWHLLTRVPVGERDRVFDRLAEFVAPPAGVTRQGVRAGQREMLDRWWDALGLGSIGMWRTWAQKWQDPK